jgi:hypothetical protein
MEDKYKEQSCVPALEKNSDENNFITILQCIHNNIDKLKTCNDDYENYNKEIKTSLDKALTVLKNLKTANSEEAKSKIDAFLNTIIKDNKGLNDIQNVKETIKNHIKANIEIFNTILKTKLIPKDKESTTGEIYDRNLAFITQIHNKNEEYKDIYNNSHKKYKDYYTLIHDNTLSIIKKLNKRIEKIKNSKLTG